jgi:hypothetical protein
MVMFKRYASYCAPRLLILLLLAIAGCLLPAGRAAAESSGEHFEVEGFHFVPSNGQAAAHSNWVTSFDFAHDANDQVHNDVRTIVVNLPAGFDASDTAVPTCTQAQLRGDSGAGERNGVQCPPASQVGTISFDIFKGTTPENSPEEATFPLYNMEVTSYGVAAELGFNAAGLVTQDLIVSVRPGDTGLTITTNDITKLYEPRDIKVTVWGLPAAHIHDPERGEECLSADEPGCLGGGESVNVAVKPFLSNPTSCGPFTATMEADSWEHPEEWSKASDVVGPIGECERVPFEPSIEVQPSTRAVESPTGLDVSLLVPQTWENPYTIATSDLRDTKVVLPEGMTANPSLAAGLGACTPAQYESETSGSLPGEGCPAESKIGSIEIETPLLDEKIDGAIYIATPYDNRPEFGDPEHPGGSLLALYIVAKDPARGLIIKVAGKIEPNPITGQLTTTFENTPQQPFSKFTLKFRPGATAPLVSPPVCGSHSTVAELTPWSVPTEPRLLSSSFETTQGLHEGPCPSGGVPPFKPQVISGTDNNNAGSYSPFYLRILREDGEQEITRFSTVLPPGLTGNLSGIPYCPEADIEAAKSLSGVQEEAEPSCPQASEIGHTIVSAGVGTVLAQTPGKVYLAGPYHGAPLSIVSITSAKVGPFDLGTVVIRFALDINPTTAQVEVSANGSDPIPHIIKGIVVHVREIRVYMDRNQFIANPTNCNHMNISETIDGAGADPADQTPVTTTAPFQAADCSSLSFKPAFSVSTSGTTSRADGASLTAKLSIPGAFGTQANIGKVKVELPKALPSRLTTLQKACTAEQFDANPAGCPPASIIGHAKAITPILPVPLEGPAYFVSHGGEAFPNLEIVLQGYGFTIDLTASTFISKAGVTSSTFKTVPDQPVTSFELTLPEGPYSALTALGNLCSETKTITVKKKVTVKVHGRRKTVTRKVKQTEPATLQMPTEFVAQNGAEIHQTTPVTVTGCSKKAVHAKSAGHRARGRKKGGR